MALLALSYEMFLILPSTFPLVNLPVTSPRLLLTAEPGYLCICSEGLIQAFISYDLKCCNPFLYKFPQNDTVSDKTRLEEGNPEQNGLNMVI